MNEEWTQGSRGKYYRNVVSPSSFLLAMHAAIAASTAQRRMRNETRHISKCVLPTSDLTTDCLLRIDMQISEFVRVHGELSQPTLPVLYQWYHAIGMKQLLRKYLGCPFRWSYKYINWRCVVMYVILRCPISLLEKRNANSKECFEVLVSRFFFAICLFRYFVSS